MAGAQQRPRWPLIAGLVLGAVITYVVDAKRNRAFIAPPTSESLGSGSGGPTSA